MSLAQKFFDTSNALQDKVFADNESTLQAAGKLIADSIAADGVLHTFGSGHSQILAAEIERRAGGLVPVSSINDPADGWPEQIAGYGARLFQRYAYQYAVQPKDVVLVISNSGRNASPIEVAMEARAAGLSVIAMTSLDMSKATTSRHPSGQKLYELADLVLDNGGIPGDAAIDAPGFAYKVGPTSTMTGALLLNLLSMEIIENLIRMGVTPPTYVSQNADGGAEHNEALAKKFRHRIRRPI
ncbi:sugar isomerase domain-containing protein [Coraliomargarita akajimensis]|uniref:Sugar isomerase (SIS) n=1 Tax=Coraliomargarita akajimensis (strain DSM 45221 / IAM 15411 / JCM 23193 / KCTC 12865 / 04OKA010-24) TaxID=583355 RepID=D5EQF4_CORAD|nr:SIS domain-containing protein [Coraliomargarita akajimensis]ADE55768.1 sugar isomerase (SIS) [Coraliomargarita akajimensis DSM 45221]